MISSSSSLMLHSHEKNRVCVLSTQSTLLSYYQPTDTEIKMLKILIAMNTTATVIKR